MKQLLATAFLAAVAFLGLTQDSQANGGGFRRCRGGCDSGCASAPCEAAPCAPAAPAPVQYEERKVKVYKQVMTTKEIDVLVCKPYTREEKYNYTVCVPVTREEKRKVFECNYVSRPVEYTYTVMVPRTVEKMVKCTTYQCVRETIREQVPVCRTVCVTCVDECGRCHTRHERVTVMEERTRCVVKHIPTVTDRMVRVTVCDAQQRKGTRTVCEAVRTEKEVMVKVCSYEHKPMVGTRTVCEYKTEKVKRTVQVCEMVATAQIVRVPVCSTSCSSPSDDCGHQRHHRAGHFRRGSGCCN
jgi:hypothetical protein